MPHQAIIVSTCCSVVVSKIFPPLLRGMIPPRSSSRGDANTSVVYHYHPLSLFSSAVYHYVYCRGHSSSPQRRRLRIRIYPNPYPRLVHLRWHRLRNKHWQITSSYVRRWRGVAVEDAAASRSIMPSCSRNINNYNIDNNNSNNNSATAATKNRGVIIAAFLDGTITSCARRIRTT